MFFVVVGTHTEHVINEFALDARINILICQCHTVTNGTDLRRSPHQLFGAWNTFIIMSEHLKRSQRWDYI